MKKKNPNLVFVCDPVMGDTGPGWYVPQTLLPIYRDEILPLADVCVPNQVCIIFSQGYLLKVIDNKSFRTLEGYTLCLHMFSS